MGTTAVAAVPPSATGAALVTDTAGDAVSADGSQVAWSQMTSQVPAVEQSSTA